MQNVKTEERRVGVKSWEDWSGEIAAGVRSVPDELLQKVAQKLWFTSFVLTAGNGGSHALASHAAQALMKPGYAPGGRVAVCLTDAVPTLTAHANDGGWPNALAELAEPFVHLRGTLLLFSSSGKSENMVRLANVWHRAAASSMKQLGGFEVVAFTGFDGGPLRQLATVSVHVDSRDYEVVEPVHDALLHRVQYHVRALGGR